MKKIFLVALILAFFSDAVFAQNVIANPFVNNASYVPAIAPQGLGCGASTTFSFTAGLSTIDDYPMPASGTPLIIIVGISSLFEFDGNDPSNYVSGAYAANLTWSYFSPTSIIGVQNQTLPGIGNSPGGPNPLASGLINVNLRVRRNAPSGSNISALVNLTAGAFMVNNNTGDDAVSAILKTYCAGISGNVFNDTTCAPHGNNDGLVNGVPVANGAPLNNLAGPTTTPSDTLLFVSLVDSSDKVVEIDSIAADGSFNFPGTTPEMNYTLVLSSTIGVIGGGPPNVTMPFGWIPVGEANYDYPNTVDNVMDGRLSVPLNLTNVANNNFGIFAPLQSPLPIEIVDFSCLVNSCEVMLTWSIANDINLTKIEVLRKGVNDDDFNIIETLENDDLDSADFKYLDTTINLNENEYLYRLRVYDNEDKILNSQICSTRINCAIKTFNVGIFPNPAMDKLLINYTTYEKDNTFKYSIIDVCGRIIKSFSKEVYNSQIIEINISDLSVGSYYLRYEKIINPAKGLIKFIKN